MIEHLIGPVTGLLDKFVEDKDQKARLAHEIATLAERQSHEIAKAQIEVNQREADHQSFFVSGWRPAVGWVCCIGLACNYLFIPMANFAFVLSDSSVTVPALDLSEMMPVLLGMLGLGSLRTWEKTKGVARK
tara:strand:+ start:485 stop:880 length:396 start_codon:yes stop_codon:yes gene_type:complete